MKVGDRLDGRYELLRAVGSGGMGTVYEALHLELGRRVAVKVLDAATDAARLAQEARALASLNHPNVVQLIDARADSWPPYLVMDLVEGRSVEDLIAEVGRIEPRRAALIGAQLLAALAAAHRAGIIHRDVKPSNVLLVDAGPMRDLVKVVDFGIAKLTIDPLKQTTTGTLLGSLAYMAPEQLLGRAVDLRADLFATGVSLYKMLSGQPAFDGPSAPRVVLAICEQEPAPLAVPPKLRAIVERAMKKNPDERFATADEMRLALEAFAESAPTGSALAGPSVLASTVSPPAVPARVSSTVLMAPMRPPTHAAPPAPPAPPAPTSHARVLVAIALALVVVSGIAAAIFVAKRVGVLAQKPRPPVAIDIPKESGLTQAEEDAIRRSLPAFETCVADLEDPPPPGSSLVIAHGGAEVTLLNPSSAAVQPLGLLFCAQKVDETIPGVRPNANSFWDP